MTADHTLTVECLTCGMTVECPARADTEVKPTRKAPFPRGREAYRKAQKLLDLHYRLAHPGVKVLEFPPVRC